MIVQYVDGEEKNNIHQPTAQWYFVLLQEERWS
jgi:hypothetical protein